MAAGAGARGQGRDERERRISRKPLLPGSGFSLFSDRSPPQRSTTMDIGQNCPADKPAQAVRERLPNRRACETQAFNHAGSLYRLTVGFYEDGRPGELFLNGEHRNSAIDTIMSD